MIHPFVISNISRFAFWLKRNFLAGTHTHTCICVSARKSYTVRKSWVRGSFGAGGSHVLRRGPERVAGTPGSQRDRGGGWHWVLAALLGCCGMVLPASLRTGLLCKKPSAPKGDSPGRQREARSSLRRRTLRWEGSGRQEWVLAVPRGYPRTARLTRQEPRPAPLLCFPAAGSPSRLVLLLRS